MASFFALIVTGCNHNHETENQTEPEKVKFQYTAYSNNFELFAEADPFIIGQTSNVLSHFSNLPDFTAVEKGTITLRIIIDGQITEQTLENPTRKGIYSFDIKPEVQGKGTLEYAITTDKGDFKVIVPEIMAFAFIGIRKKYEHDYCGTKQVSINFTSLNRNTHNIQYLEINETILSMLKM
jgi:hypothetical protein